MFDRGRRLLGCWILGLVGLGLWVSEPPTSEARSVASGHNTTSGARSECKSRNDERTRSEHKTQADGGRSVDGEREIEHGVMHSILICGQTPEPCATSEAE